MAAALRHLKCAEQRHLAAWRYTLQTAINQLPHFLAFRSLGFSMRLTSANLRVFLALPMLCSCLGRHINAS